MFKHHCSACDRTQLIFWNMGTSATRSEAGIAFTFTCWCGAEQTHQIADIRDLEPALTA